MFKALVVEDNRDICRFFELTLSDAGFEVDSSLRGDVALAKLEVGVPDVVILDLHLPGAGGTKILDRIRGDDRLRDTRVIVTTSDSKLAESLHEKADLVLVKPISYEQLRELSCRMKPSASLLNGPAVFSLV